MISNYTNNLVIKQIIYFKREPQRERKRIKEREGRGGEGGVGEMRKEKSYRIIENGKSK